MKSAFFRKPWPRAVYSFGCFLKTAWQMTAIPAARVSEIAKEMT
jgi:hypothetical protein